MIANAITGKEPREKMAAGDLMAYIGVPARNATNATQE